MDKVNQLILELCNKYQKISCGKITVPVPYFINYAEQAYKTALGEAGCDVDIIKKTLEIIRLGKTPLGSTGGKGSPEELETDLDRLLEYLNKQGYYPKKPVHIITWMSTMHIGLDCSGFAYNVLEFIGKELGKDLISKLAWKDPNDRKRSHAGVSVFDSPNFREIKNYSDLRPLDLLIPKDHLHIGVVVQHEDSLAIVECSMGKNGISFSKIDNDSGLKIKESDYWTGLIDKNELIVKRVIF